MQSRPSSYSHLPGEPTIQLIKTGLLSLSQSSGFLLNIDKTQRGVMKVPRESPVVKKLLILARKSKKA
jgi:hypothetical protein